MRAIYMTPEVTNQLEAAGFKKIDAGVIGNNPDSFHSGVNSSAFKAMVGQVGDAKRLEKNKDEKYLAPEAYLNKYGTEKK